MSLTLLNKNLAPAEPAVLENTKGKSMNQQVSSGAQLRCRDCRLAKPEEAKVVQEAVRFLAGVRTAPEALTKMLLLPACGPSWAILLYRQLQRQH